MKEALRVLLVYIIPFLAIVAVDRLPVLDGYIGPVVLIDVVWMFCFHHLTKSWQTPESGRDAV
jgi:hypothetical protein